MPRQKLSSRERRRQVCRKVEAKKLERKMKQVTQPDDEAVCGSVGLAAEMMHFA